MPIRKLLLRIMLGSLALSAVAGVLAVLMAERDVVWRAVGTGLLAAVGSSLLLVLSLLIDKAKSRPAGLAGMGAVVAAFLLSLMLVWDFNLSSHGDWALALTLLLVLGAAPPLMFFLRVMFVDRGKWAGIVGVIGCGIGVALLLVAIWGEKFSVGISNIGESLTLSAWAVSAFSGMAAGSLAGVGVDRRWWRWIGVATAALGCIMALIGVWAHIQSGGLALTIVTGAAVIVAHANLVFLCNLRPNQEWVRWGTVGAVAVTSVLLDVLNALGEPGGVGEFVSRGAGAAAIVAGCGTLALLVLARLNRKIPTETRPVGVKELAIVCPWCQRKQTLPLGASSCAGCGLKFQIAVEEPRCPNCDYLLYMLTSDRCPECGTPVHPQIEAAPTAMT